ncbi:MAG TPA: chemotaxis protein CheW [Limnobacter sp.]|nr:chemotaxis protein CheW [Limnobacter sp.]
MQRVKYRGIEVPVHHVQLLKCIDSVNELIDDMKDLQSSWDNLSLLGELTRVGTEISGTRQNFKALSENLSNSLIEQSISDAAQQLECKAQNAIDILVRNLFERTADIGFLCTDLLLGEACQNSEAGNILPRMQSYIAKYSVYRNMVLISADGQVVCDLLGLYSPKDSARWLIDAVARSQCPYVERHGPLLDHGDSLCDLVYAWKVQIQGSVAGYIALQFNLEHESTTLFSKVLGQKQGDLKAHDMSWTVCGIADANMRVLVSSDEHHIAPGMQLQLIGDGQWRIARIGATAYMACVRPTRGYQGYMGPGWLGFALVPIHQAFVQQGPKASDDPSRQIEVREGLIKREIQQYREQAEHIQMQLNRSVWNGNISQRKSDQALGESFSKTLLWEISRAGERTKQLFERALHDLMMRAIDRLQVEQEACAMLAMDLMDRNLYERANDCRWWADNPLLLECLNNPGDPVLLAKAEACLKHINSLYTVYTNVLLFDAQGNVVCSSNPHTLTGALVTPWLQKTMRQTQAQQYVVSPFENTPLYDDRPTYIYCAPVLSRSLGSGRAQGAVAVVFDSEPQFDAILQESMAGHQHHAMAYIVDEQGQVVSSTSDRFVVDNRLQITLNRPSPFVKQSHWHQMLELEGKLYAVGCCNSGSYREYKSEQDCYQNNLTCIYLVQIGQMTAPTQNKPLCFEHLRNVRQRSHSSLEVATFRVGTQWYGIDSEEVQESFLAKHLATMPNASACVMGSTLHRGKAVTVIDLEFVMDECKYPSDTHRKDTEVTQLVLLKDHADGPVIALVVDELGEIPNVPVDEIRPTEQLMGNNPLIAGLIKTPDNLLLLLEPSKILSHFRVKEKGLFNEEAFGMQF